MRIALISPYSWTSDAERMEVSRALLSRVIAQRASMNVTRAPRGRVLREAVSQYARGIEIFH
jgi:hypothetical protein